MSTPQAEKIILSHRQQTLLKQIVRRTTNPYRLVRRAQLILLAAAGVSNTQLNRDLQLERGQVRLWRERWLAATSQLATVEAENSSDRELMALIMRVLSDSLTRQLRFTLPSWNNQLLQHRASSANCCLTL